MPVLRISIFRVLLYSNIAFYKAWAGLSTSVDSSNWTYEYVKWLYAHIVAFISSCLFSSDGETHWEKGISTIRLILIYVIKQIISLLLISPIDYSVDAMQRPTSHFNFHCSDVIMSTMASHFTSLTIVYLTVYSGVDQKRKTSKLRVTDLCAGNSTVTSEFPTEMASNAENVSIWWR